MDFEGRIRTRTTGGGVVSIRPEEGRGVLVARLEWEPFSGSFTLAGIAATEEELAPPIERGAVAGDVRSAGLAGGGAAVGFGLERAAPK